MKKGVLAVLPLLVLLPVGALIVIGRFDGLYGQDAYAYHTYATGSLLSDWLHLRPLPPFHWPPGFPLLAALAGRLVGASPQAGQLVSWLAGSLTPLFAALWAWELGQTWGEARQAQRLAWLTGLLTALTGQLWQSSAVYMSDTPALAATTLGMWATARFGRLATTERGASGWLWLAAGALAWAVLTRWAAALAAIPAALYALSILARQPWRRAWPAAFGATLLVAVCLWPVAAPAWRYLSGGRAAVAAQTDFAVDLAVVAWNPRHAVQRSFETADGFQTYRWPNGLFYAAAPAHRYYFTPWLAWLLGPGVWAAWRRRQSAWLMLVGGWLGLSLGFLMGAAWQNFRFTLAFLPPVALLTALGWETVYAGLRPAWRRWAWAWLAVGAIWMAYGGYTLTQAFIERKAADLHTVAWLEQQVEPDARLVTFGLTLTFQEYSALPSYEIFYQTPATLAALLAEGHPTYVLLDTAVVETQWRGRAPGLNYAWLQAHSRLLPLGQERTYTLFRANPGRPPDD